MAQLFVSHSKLDEDLVAYLSRVVAGTKVQMIFEELEKIPSGSVTPQQIEAHIESSRALFIMLTPNVSNQPHTRDWVAWEAGHGGTKDVWVFERASLVGLSTVVIPRLRHYVVFEPNDAWFSYFRNIINSYDDSQVLPGLAAGSGLAALVAAAAAVTVAPVAVIGGLVGAALSNKENSRPSGLQIQCSACGSSYSVHLPNGWTHFRCPVCNTVLTLAIPQ